MPSQDLAAETVGLRSFLPAGGMLLASFAVLVWLSFRPAADATQVAAVFPPWVGFAEIQTRLDGSGMRLVRSGIVDNIAVVDLGEADQTALLRRGAWLIGDPLALGGCFTPVPGA